MLLAAFSCLPLSAQVALEKIPLKIRTIEIRHVGPPAVSDDLIRANIRVKVGDVIDKIGNTYDVKNTTVDVQTLKATGYFSNIGVAVEEVEDGVKLIYMVYGKLVLTDVRFEGNKKYSNSKLLKKVSSKIGEPLDEYKLFKDSQEIQSRTHNRTQGHLDGLADHAARKGDQERGEAWRVAAEKARQVGMPQGA